MAEVFALRGVKWMLFIVSIAAVVAMTSVLLVFQMGQPRIWMSMSRDGLLPKRFASIHPKYKTPGFSTIVTGLVVGIPIFFTDESFILDFTSIGTSIRLRARVRGRARPPKRRTAHQGPFPSAVREQPLDSPGDARLGAVALLLFAVPGYFPDLLDLTDEHAAQNIPQLIFWPLTLLVVVLAHLKQWSLIPVLGLLSCCYLLTGMAVSNWSWFSSLAVDRTGLLFPLRIPP